jgi:prolipoprotein diacylglyceryltransferase
MSYHGGLIGVVVATLIFVRKNGMDFFNVADLIVPCIPLGYTFGRVGNFINGELFGRVTTHPIGMYFPFAPGPGRRHPSQLYEAFFEGIVLFVVLWAIKARITTRGAMLALYLMGYGLVRFFIEYARQPDAHLGFIWLSLSMGQLLCMAMILAGGCCCCSILKSFEHPPPRGKRDPLLGLGADHHRLDQRLSHRLLRPPCHDEFGTGPPAFVRFGHHIAFGGHGIEGQRLFQIVFQELAV